MLLMKSWVCVESKNIYPLQGARVSVISVHIWIGFGERRLVVIHISGCAYQWIILMYPCIANGDDDLCVPPLANISHVQHQTKEVHCLPYISYETLSSRVEEWLGAFWFGPRLEYLLVVEKDGAIA